MSHLRKQKFARGAQGNSAQQRFDTLKNRRNDERATAIANGSFADPDRPRSLADAITPVGICQDKCPEFERLERITQNDVWEAEKDLNDRRKPDESRMVKKFKRAAAGTGEQLPSDLRPPQTLKTTCDYLFNDLLAEDSSLSKYHHFIWDRTRAVRNDFSIQQVSKISDVRLAIDCFERIARFLILSLHYFTQQEKTYDGYTAQQDREQLDKTLLSLMQYYDDNRARLHSPNEAEFRAYCIIFQIQDRVPDLEDRVQTWPRHIIQDPRVQKALQLYAAACTTDDAEGPLRPTAPHPTAQANWSRWWGLVASNEISYLMSCVAETYSTRVRHTALAAIFAAYKVPKKNKYEWSQQDLVKALGFDGADNPIEAMEDFCRAYEFDFFVDDGTKYINLNSVAGKRLIGPTTSQKAGFNWLVEKKRHGRTLSAAISGMSVKQARDAGHIREDPRRPQQRQHSNGLLRNDANDEMHDTGVSQSKPVAQANSTQGTQRRAVFNLGTATKVPESKAAENVKPTNPFAGATPPVASTKTPLSFGSRTSTIKLPSPPTTSLKPPFTFGSGASINKLPSSPSSSNKSPSFSGFSGPNLQTSSVPPATPKPSFAFGAGDSTVATPAISAAPSETPFTFGNSGSIPPTPTSSAPFATTTSSFTFGTVDSTEEQSFASTYAKPSPFAKSSPKKSEAETSGVTPVDDTFSFESRSTQVAQPVSQASSKSPIAELRGRPPDQSQSQSQTQLAKSQTFLSPNSVQSKVSPPEQDEAKKRRAEADAIAKRRIRDSQTLDQLARELVLGPYGFLDQYIEYTAPRIIVEIRDQVGHSKDIQQADQFRQSKLATRYGLKWKEIPWKKRLAAQGKSRRQRLRADREATERRSRENSISATIQDFRNSMGASSSRPSAEKMPQDEIIRPAQASRTAPQPVPVDAFGNSLLSIPPSSPRIQQSGNPTNAGHRRTESAPSRSLRLAGLRSVRQNRPSPSSRLRHSLLPGQSFDESASSAASSVRADTTRSTYFKLKAMGLESPPVAKRRRSDSGGSLMSRPGKRLTTSVSPLQASSNPEQPKEKPTQPHMQRSTATNEEDEELFAQIREVRDAMSDSMTFFQEERKKDEDFRLSRSGAGSADTPPGSEARPSAIRDWKAIAEERIDKALRASPVKSTTPHEKARELPPAYRSRISKFLPRERYADRMMAQRQDVGDRPKYVPNRFRKVERKHQETEEEASSPTAKTVMQDTQPPSFTSQQPEHHMEHESATPAKWQEGQPQQFSQHEASDLQPRSQPGMWGSVDPALFTGQNTFLFDTPSMAAPSELQPTATTSKSPAAAATDFSTFLDIPSSPPQQPVQSVHPSKSALPPVEEIAPAVKEVTPPQVKATPSKVKESIFTPESSFYNGVNGPSTASQWPLDSSSSSFGTHTATDNTFGKALSNANKTVTDMLASSFGQPPKPTDAAASATITKAKTGGSTSSFGLFGQTSSNSKSSFAGFGQLSNSKPSVGFSFGPSTSKVPSQPQAERIQEAQLGPETFMATAVPHVSPSGEAKQPPSQAEPASYQLIDLADSDEEDQDAGNTTEFDSSRPQSRENASLKRTLAKPSPPPLKRQREESEKQQPRKTQRVASTNPFELLSNLEEESEAGSLVSQTREPSQAISETSDPAPQDQQNHEHEHQHQRRRTSIELTAADAQRYLEREASEGEEAPGFGEDLDALEAFNASHAACRNTSSASQSGFEYEGDFEEGDFDDDGSDAASLSREAFARYYPDQIEEDDNDDEKLTPKHSSAVRNQQHFVQDAQGQAQMGLDDGLEYEDKYEDEDEDPEVYNGMDYSDEEVVDQNGDENGFEEDGSLADDDDESDGEDGDEDEEQETDSSRTSPPAKKREPNGVSSKSRRGQGRPSQLINGKGGTSAEDAIEL